MMPKKQSGAALGFFRAACLQIRRLLTWVRTDLLISRCLGDKIFMSGFENGNELRWIADLIKKNTHTLKQWSVTYNQWVIIGLRLWGCRLSLIPNNAGFYVCIFSIFSGDRALNELQQLHYFLWTIFLIWKWAYIMCCCWEGVFIIGNVPLCCARGLRGHCVNAAHLPADRSPDWLLMTFLGQRHVKLFIYSKIKSPMQIALSTLDPPRPDCVSANKSVLVSVSLSRTRKICCGHQQSLWDKNRTAVFFVYVCVCLCTRFLHVTDMGHPWLPWRKWHTAAG